MKKFSIKCFFGWHSWSWLVSELGWGNNGLPPKNAKCVRCGITYGKGD